MFSRYLTCILTSVALMAGVAGLQASSHDLSGKKVAILIGDGYHDGEALAPLFYLRDHGAEVVLISTEKGRLSAYNSEVSIDVKHRLADHQADDFDALIIPGGRSPSNLRDNEDVIRFVQTFAETGKPIASICHGPQVLVSAGLLDGVKTTCIASISDEVKEAGANYVDQAVVIDGQFISSRLPPDLPYFNKAIANALSQG
jgi:protease I